MYSRSLLTLILVGIGGGEVTCAGCINDDVLVVGSGSLGIETLGILRMVEPSEVDGDISLSADADLCRDGVGSVTAAPGGGKGS